MIRKTKPLRRKKRRGVKPVMPNIGLNEIIIVAIVIVVLFGSRALPNFIRGIAKAIREFRHAKKGDE
ncbi:TPA: hypothetical protein DIU27_04490 [Candidatus Collierbacteria bacterium]|nr:hypothetical protein [Candidatus Collierbacteria bacterium]